VVEHQSDGSWPVERLEMRAIGLISALLAFAVGVIAESWGNVRWTRPAGWHEQANDSRADLIQRMPGTMLVVYGIRGIGVNSADAQSGISYLAHKFGPVQSAPPEYARLEAFIKEWKQQVIAPDGQWAEAKIQKLALNGLDALIIDTRGTYHTGSRTQTPYRRGFRVLGAVIGAPDGEIFVKLVGPENTINVNQNSFYALVKSIHWIASQ
jgi:hypothetical protein